MESPPTSGGALLAKIMIERDLMQAQVADQTGLNQSTISRLLHGGSPSRSCAMLLQAKFDIPIEAWPVRPSKRKGGRSKAQVKSLKKAATRRPAAKAKAA